MTNIDFSLSKFKLEEELATVLHQSPFDEIWEKTNFSVHLHRPRATQNRTGTLTLPYIEIGELFLNWHSYFQIGGRTIKFRRSSKPPRPDIIKKIRTTPYVQPPKDIQGELDMHIMPVNVASVQFGWLCRDHAISVECEHSCLDSNISFDSERREIRVHVDEINSFAIRSSSIAHLSASAVERALVFELEIPPSYEREGVPVVPNNVFDFLASDRRPPPRTKLSHLPIPDHERVAPFTSLVIRVICASYQDLERFRKQCEADRFRRVEDYEYRIVHRGLFSATAMTTVQWALDELDWPVAFQLEALLRGMAIDYVEAIQLIPEIYETVKSRGKLFTTIAIRNFKDKVKAYFHNEDDDGASFNIVEFFRQTAIQSSDQDNSMSSQPDGSLYESLHVEVTPTTMFLSGPFPERSNRVIRAYDVENQESFLRVSFVDEGGFHIRFDREVDGREFIRSRVGPLLFEGLEVAGRKFDFLAYSQSALKEHSVW